MSRPHGGVLLAPLEPDDPRLVPPVGRAVADVVDRVRRGLAPLLLVGHAGVGKTTLLRGAHRALLDGAFAVRIDLPPSTDPDRVLYDIAVETVQAWVQTGPEQQPSPFLVQDLRASDPSFPQGQGRTLAPAAIALAAWDELTGAAGLVERLPLLIDGLDRLEPGTGRRVALQLLALAPRADLVVVASPELAVGPDNAAVLEAFRVLDVAPVPVDTEAGEAMLAAVARAHVGEAIEPVVAPLVRASGGVLRDLVSLAHDAVAYADGAVDEAALAAACADRTERLRRLLIAGDAAALAAAHGTSGAEVPADRKVRLLASGALIERGVGPGAMVTVHPLVAPLIAPSPLPAEAP